MKRSIIALSALAFSTLAWAHPEITREQNVATNETIQFYTNAGAICTDPGTVACSSAGRASGAARPALSPIAGTPTRVGTTAEVLIPLTAAEVNFDLVDVSCTSTCTDAVSPKAFTINTVQVSSIAKQSATEVWTYSTGNRELTHWNGNPINSDLATPADIWANPTRTLTGFGFNIEGEAAECLLALVRATLVGRQTSSGTAPNITYTFRNQADTANRVSATFNTTNQTRTTATVTCP